MIKALIIAHGNMAQELLNAAITILGDQQDVFTLSNTELSLAGLQQNIKKHIVESLETIIFVDCFGSPLTAAIIAGGGAPVISGVNLPMLLSFFTKRGAMPLKELAETVAADGQKGISIK